MSRLKSSWRKFKQYLYNDYIVRTASILFALAFAAQIYININTNANDGTYSYPFLDPLFVLLMIQILLGMFIASRFDHLYWIRKPDDKTFNEKQNSSRRKIFETSYTLATFLSIATVLSLEIVKPYFVYGSLAVFGFIYLLFALPSLVAVWREEA